MMSRHIRRIALLCALILAVSLLLGGCSRTAPRFADLDFSSVDASLCVETDQVTDYVKISVVDHGDIIIRLFPDVAPKTVKNFKNLVSEGFYDGLTFHRIITGFMIQGGDPQGDGYGSSSKKIKGEFSANGFQNNLKHIRGVISMARGGMDNNSASCQFFIMHQTTADLNGKYASFGYVVSGMEVVDSIASVAVGGQEKSTPLSPVVIESIRFVTVAE